MGTPRGYRDRWLVTAVSPGRPSLVLHQPCPAAAGHPQPGERRGGAPQFGGCCGVGGTLGSLTRAHPIQDLLKHTPADHPDYPLLQDALRISQNFLSSINEDIDPRRTAVTTPKGEVRRAGWHGVVAEPSASPRWCLHPEELHGARPGGGGGGSSTQFWVRGVGQGHPGPTGCWPLLCARSHASPAPPRPGSSSRTAS